MVRPLSTALLLFLLGRSAQAADAPPEKSYVGVLTCKRCHGEQYESYQRSAKKARSFAAVERMKKKLTADELKGCYDCHTTGHGKPGGFVSLEKTPDRANTGCEVCHGPGSKHAGSQSKVDIERSPDTKRCEGCHVASRIKAFNYRPVLRAGAH